MNSYLALGDSYTIGEQLSIEDSFPYQTARLLKKDDIDVGIPVIIARTGWTTDELSDAILERNIQETFSVVSLLIGVNNQYRGRSLNEYEHQFTQLLDRAIRSANGHARHVFVLSIPDWGVTPFAKGRDRDKIAKEIDEYNRSNKEITLSHKCVYIDITDSTRAAIKKPNEGYIAGDGLHPSAKEYSVWAERLAVEIKKVLKS